jgi:bifunctional non-homologous end joining protein LigD
MAARSAAVRAHSAKGDLKAYRAKRDFGKTPEPAGQPQPSARRSGLRFVIQKHAARRLHYDLRLELDGVYKSWAVTRGPSLDPQEKRLAVHVEDHPIEYGDFEGVIPQGEYGGGTVMIWDRGEWTPDGDPARGYEKGHLAFVLNGEKLSGRWHLVRTKPKPREKKEQWLFFKSDDAFARSGMEGDILDDAPKSVATGRPMEEIAGSRDAVWSSWGGLIAGQLLPDRACGQGVEPLEPQSIAGAAKAVWPGFVRPCLALLAANAPEGEGWLHEIKFDGYRLAIHIQKGEVRILTRSGLDWTHRFPAIAGGFAEAPAESAMIDGEAVVVDAHGVSNFSALQAALAEGNAAQPAVFYAFDLMYLDGYDLRGASLDDRKAALHALLARFPHPGVQFSEHILDDGPAMVEHACRLGLEGVVSKKRGARYRSGRGGAWLKIKCINSSEFVIGGYMPSTAMRGAIGSLVLGYHEDGKLIHAGRTGTGFTQASARALHAALSRMKRERSPFATALTADERRGVIFVEPRLVAEVEFRGWTADQPLRHAAFKGLREDKPPEEVTLELPVALAEPAAGVKEVESMAGRAPEGRAKPRVKPGKGGSVEFEGVTLTHPDRILWEGQGLTKLGLAEYYAGIAGHILPHIAGRPLALVRCPSGSGGGCFYQKHAFAGLTDAVEVIPVQEKDGPSETLIIRDLRGLVLLVQASVLEIHPWGARIEDVERPDRIIFDLDPGDGVPWADMIEAARDIRGRLEAQGIRSFVKTTGGKGLHVVAPIVPRLGWDEVKAWCKDLASSMERDNPERYLTTMTKKLRTGKIFVDYLRNGRGATAIATYSTRARPGAPVSTPIRWDELGPAMTPARFTVENLPRRLVRLKTDPWQGFFTLRQHLPAPSGETAAARP